MPDTAIIYVMVTMLYTALGGGFDRPAQEAGWFDTLGECTAAAEAFEVRSGLGWQFFAHCERRVVTRPSAALCGLNLFFHRDCWGRGLH